MSSIPTLDSLRRQRKEILAIAAQYGASNIRIFGSVARGDATEGSDIDILVKFPPTYKLLQHAGLIVALKELLDRDVDVSVEGNVRQEYQPSIMHDAVPL